MAEKILIVDDDPAVLFTTRRVLESAGYDTETASEWKECLKKVSVHDFDLIILDIMMPEVTGNRLYAALKKNNPGQKIMFLSAVAPSGEILNIMQKEKIVYLQKPYDRQRLVKFVKQAILGEKY